MTCKSLSRSLIYNEEKIALGKAECLMAANFLKDRDRLSLDEKLRCFERRMELNDRVKTSLHITLNFDPKDKLNSKQMQQIARMYMEDIGFGRQPYLVYRHHDAGHPHCHIVTTHVRSDGSPIDLYEIGRNQSERARERIEREFELVTAEMKEYRRQQVQKMDGVSKVKYGEKPLARSVSEVLEYVTERFNYTSMEELNAVLRLYNVEAYRGPEQSRLYQNRGLLFRVLDEHGHYIGRPLKASFFDCQPTLENLEEKFRLNQAQRLEHSEHTRIQVTVHLLGEPGNLSNVAQDLLNAGIRMHIQSDEDGKCKEVVYIDMQSKCVVSGDELGKRCGREAIQQVMDREERMRQEQTLQETERHSQRYRLRLGL